MNSSVAGPPTPLRDEQQEPVSTGPVQGAARKPDTLPMRNAPATPAPPTEFSFACSG